MLNFNENTFIFQSVAVSKDFATIEVTHRDKATAIYTKDLNIAYRLQTIGKSGEPILTHSDLTIGINGQINLIVTEAFLEQNGRLINLSKINDLDASLEQMF
jgi:hypothetical protein